MAVVADAAVDEALRLELVDQVDEPPGLFGGVDAAVEPDEAERAVFGE